MVGLVWAHAGLASGAARYKKNRLKGLLPSAVGDIFPGKKDQQQHYVYHHDIQH
jgi:hypothetical protein